MPTIAEVIADATERLKSVTETPHLDAEILLAHALKIPRARLLAQLREETDPKAFETLLERRIAAEPIAYILGEWEFYSLNFEIQPPVLVPRPETEHLVEVALERIGEQELRVLDIGTGSGCVTVAIAHNAKRCTVVATDINPAFLDLARRNAKRHGVTDQVAFREGDLFAALNPGDAPFDIICSNPPYVAQVDWENVSPTVRDYEDPRALLAGADGLDVIRSLIDQAQDFLAPGGLLALEIGFGQAGDVQDLLRDAGYEAIDFRQDLAAIDRIALGSKPAR